MPAFLLAWLASPRAWLIAGAGAALVAAALYVHALQSSLAAARAEAATAHAAAVAATDQTAATQSAAAIADQGAHRAALDITVHQDNQHAIQASPGAAAPLAPALNRAGRGGLCRYDAYADDPACVGLRRGDPAVLPQAGGGDPAAGR